MHPGINQKVKGLESKEKKKEGRARVEKGYAYLY